MRYDITKFAFPNFDKMRVMVTTVVLFLMIDGSMTRILFAINIMYYRFLPSMNELMQDFNLACPAQVNKE